MTRQPQVLMVMTSHGRMGNTGKSTGVWFEELATPYYAFRDAGARVVLASIQGGPVPVDPSSHKLSGGNEPSVERFVADAEAMSQLTASIRVDRVSMADFDAIFLPGGHGTMWDLPGSDALTRLVSEAWRTGKVVAAVCHGPAGLLSATDAAGASILASRHATAFTNAEERAAGLTDVVPFLLETRMRELGAVFKNAPDFQPFSIADGQLVTGQNPASATRTAELVMERLRQK